eukprot:GILK01008114.1.p1 GENE.GILK01008114.1~~GILK01008114.1.p1  ORF type:complete len:750 (-),score=75.21 GILK01008114.1:177-2426(-)
MPRESVDFALLKTVSDLLSSGEINDVESAWLKEHILSRDPLLTVTHPSEAQNIVRRAVASFRLNDGLPPSWKAYQTETGQTYYYNDTTQETTWTKPSASLTVAAVPSPSAAPQTQSVHQFVRVLYDFTAQEPAQISIVVGETLEIFEENGDGWCRGSVCGATNRSGWVPSSYVTVLTSEHLPLTPSTTASTTTTTTTSTATAAQDEQLKTAIQTSVDILHAPGRRGSRRSVDIRVTPIMKVIQEDSTPAVLEEEDESETASAPAQAALNLIKPPSVVPLRRRSSRRASSVAEIQFVHTYLAYSWGTDLDNVKQRLPQLDLRLIRLLQGVRCVRSIACGIAHVVVLTDKGTCYSWGSSAEGALGSNTPSDTSVPCLMQDLEGVNVLQVAVGDSHTILCDDEGFVYTCGSGKNGRLGHGTDANELTPKKIQWLEDQDIFVMRVAAGAKHNLILADTGIMYSFGCGRWGRLGIGSEQDQFSPQQIAFMTKPGSGQARSISDISCGATHSGAIDDNGGCIMWGGNDEGQCGLGNSSHQKTPQVVHMDKCAVTQLVCGGFHTLCVTSIGIFSWGRDTYGQLGRPNTDYRNIRNTVVTSPGLIFSFDATVTVKSIAAGANHSCLLTDKDELWTWGCSDQGQLGFETSDSSSAMPSKIESLAGRSVSQVYCGENYTIATCTMKEVPSADVTSCMQCNVQFTFIKRRHHCRNCGGIFCDDCSKQRRFVPGTSFQEAVRVCDGCLSVLAAPEPKARKK